MSGLSERRIERWHHLTGISIVSFGDEWDNGRIATIKEEIWLPRKGFDSESLTQNHE